MSRRPDELNPSYGYMPGNTTDPSSGPASTNSHLQYEQASYFPTSYSPTSYAPVPSASGASGTSGLSEPFSTNPSSTTYWAESNMTTYNSGHYDSSQRHGEPVSPESPIDPAALQFALPPDIFQTGPSFSGPDHDLPSADAFEAISTAYYDEPQHNDVGNESDRVPLTTSAQPISGTLKIPPLDTQSRDSFHTVRDFDGSSTPTRDSRMLGFDLEHGLPSGGRQHSYGNSLTPEGTGRRSRSSSTAGALQRTASIMRAMSQRVVDISGGGEALEQQAIRDRSRSPSADGRKSQQQVSSPMLADFSYASQVFPTPQEKKSSAEFVIPQPSPHPEYHLPMPNPLRGRTLGVFSANNPIRLFFCDLLMQPWVETLILALIILQAVLLAVDAGPDVWTPGNGRPERWGQSRFDWPMLGLFIVFTLEIMMRIIVSGFIFNAPEYSTIDRKEGVRQGVRAAVTEQYRSFFKPQRQRSVKRPPADAYGPSSFSRSFTLMQGQPLPQTYEDQQRMQLARRAFLRHSFNRLDFVAVVSFWISFLLSISGIESRYHLYVFRMLSCLRIIRLLGITQGNAIILRSLKKAAPLLVRVSFLIGFFWLLFAIIGVQSFKSSLSRQCVWIDPSQPDSLDAAYTNDFGFCGGHLKNDTEATPTTMPWVYMLEDGNLSTLVNGTRNGKGFICPRGSICLQQSSPYNATVNFDNILQSLELVFVIMSANTFSDLMYYTTNSDYLAAALFFVAGIMIMMLWMTNLLIAVITSSFQLIREENKSSAFTADEKDFSVPRPDKPLRRVSALQHIYNRSSWIWVVAIAFDLLAQAFRSAAHEDRAHFINTCEVVVTIFLDIEMVIRFAADWRRFHRNFRNMFDLGLAVITTVILLPPIHNMTRVYAWLTVFQVLRVYRVVLAIPMTRTLIKLVLGNATGIANLVLFVFLITFLAAIFAVQLFRGEITPVDDTGDDIRITFASIFNSFLGMYQVLSSENWTSVLYTVTGFTTVLHTSWIGAVFLIGWFILSYFILVNMFIAVIQENFDVSEDQKRLEQVKAFLQRKELGSSASNLSLSAMFSLGRRAKRKDPLDYGPAMMEMLLKEAVVRDFLNEALDPLQGASLAKPVVAAQNADIPSSAPEATSWLTRFWVKIKSITSDQEPNPFYSNVFLDTRHENMDPRQMARQAVTATSARRRAQREYLSRYPTYNNSLFIFTPRNPIRRLCQRLVGPGRGSERVDGVEPNKYAWYIFSAFIYASIVAMVCIACVTTPLYQKQYFDSGHIFSFKNWFVWTDAAFALVFSFETVVKIIADGFFWTPNAYFRSSWGVIDAMVLITLWINVATLFANDGAISRAVGAFKALRALRLLNVSDSARETFHSLMIIGGWKILSAAFVSISLLIPFAIYGLNLFRGQMVTCNDGSGSIIRLEDCTGEYLSAPYSSDWQFLSPRVAENPYYSFDDFGSAILILFTIVSQEGWVDVSFQAQSLTGLGFQPQFGAAKGNAVFFVVFNLLATVFILTLFISVFMRNYTEQTGVAFLTGDQRAWLELRKLLRQISPSKTSYDDSKNKVKMWCHKRAIEKHGKWHLGITMVLVLHLILLIMEYSSEPDWWTNTRDYIFLVLTLVYMANNTIRILGLGWSRFRRSSWDMFSLCAVAGAFATSILFLAIPKEDTLIQLHKFFLVAIVLLLIPRNDALDQLFKTAAASVKTIGSLVATWFVFFLVFAIALTQSFSLTRFNTQETNHVNLRTVPNALILLFRMSCGEGWNQLMEDFASVKPPLCVEASTFFGSDCGSTAWARVLFIAWNIISMYIFVNLFVSLIVESFSYVYQRSSGLADISRDEIRRFKEAWRSVDPDGTGYISRDDFPRLLAELSGVFEMRIYDHEDSVGSIIDYARNDAATPQARHTSLASQSALNGINLQKLNERINQIDINRVRERRRRFNIFYEEVMVTADPDKGICFTTVLMILAHYNIISDSKSLKLEEFLRRRARLQRVEEEVRRRVVVGFFNTLYWSKKFRKHLEMKQSARMTGVPQLGIPDILVDDEEEKATKGPDVSAVPSRATSTYLSAEDAASKAQHHRSWSGASMDISLHDTNYAHPLSLSRAIPLASAPPNGSGGLQPQKQQQHNSSIYSFELQDPSDQGGAGSRRGSAVREMLDDSVWVESIRRSATQRQRAP